MEKIISILSILIVLPILTLSSCDTSTAPPPTNEENLTEQTMDVVYDNVMTYQLSYIRSLQLSSGAIKDKDTSNSKITPYFAHFAVLALLKDPTNQNLEAVKKYIKWYLGKLNGITNPYKGGAEIEGSVYDYFGDSETTQGTYDSVDSYAATFLEIIMEFAQTSGENKSWLEQYKSKISLVASAMVKTIDTDFNQLPGTITEDENDGLSVASYVYDVKYLMDNCEVNIGLKAAKWLKDNNLIDNDYDFAGLLAKNTEGIGTLWNGTTYDWWKSNSVTTDWKQFYPDATAQLYPGMFNVIEPNSQTANKLYTQFNKTYTSWASGVTYSSFPWTIIAYAAATINDAVRVNTYLKHINSLNIKGQQKTNWYSMEAGCIVLAIDRIKNPVVDSEYTPIN